MFQEIPNRDAWATIRGFVYQVDMTIIEWLKLKKNQILELEKGEDIDIVNFDHDGTEKNREEIQVKRKDIAFSLNDKAILSSILNFVESKLQNPECDLKFRFLTNNPYKIERPAIIPNGQLAIATWQAIQNKEINSESYAQIIQQHLLNRFDQQQNIESKKEKIEALQKAISFLNDSDCFKWLINNFTFSSQSGKNETTQNSCIGLIIYHNFAEDKDTAKQVYHLLFFTVFKILSKKGQKRLSLDLLKNTVKRELTTSENELYSMTKQFIEDYENKFQSLEQKVSKNTDAIDQLIQKSLPEQQNTVFNYKINAVSYDVPLEIKNGSARDSKVKELIESFQEKTWIHFCGLSGNGKTQLAILLCKQFKQPFWLDLRDFFKEEDSVHLVVEAFLSVISAKEVKNNRATWLKDVVGTLPENSIIVLNDLPKIESTSKLGNLLSNLFSVIEGTSIKILTTSNHEIKEEYRQFLSDNVIPKYTNFAFSDDEIKEYLIKMGSPENVTDYVFIIADVTHRNPRLLTTLILNLKAINWGQNSTDILGEIVKEDFAEDILADNQRSIKKYITSESSRKLLYRLSLINWGLNKSIIKSIAGVEENINNYGECLSDLINVWVEKLYKDTYQVSPLIYNIGRNNLLNDEVKRVHLKVASSLASKGLINQIDAKRIIDSFIEAEEFDKAGASLMNIYIAAREQPEIEVLREWGLLSYWLAEEIPSQMNIILRAYIRFQQITLYQELDTEATWLDSSIYNLLLLNRRSGTAFENITLAILSLSAHNERTDLLNFWTAVDVILENWANLSEKEEKHPFSTEVIYNNVWRIIPYLKTKSDVITCFEYFEKVEKTFNESLFRIEIANTSIQLLSSRIRFDDIDTGNDDFGNLKTLELLLKVFIDKKLETFEAIIYKDLINLEIDYELKTREEAIRSFRVSIDKFKVKSAKVILLNSGSLLVANEHGDKESAKWLREAVNTEATNEYHYIDSLVRLGTVEKPEVAIQHFERAIELGNSLNYLHPVKSAKIYSEIAISNWQMKNYEETFLNFQKTVEILFEQEEQSSNEDWVRTLVLTGHSMGYIAADISSNRKIEYTNDGSNYTVPYSGIVYLNDKDLTDYHKERFSPTIMAQLAMIADGAGKLEKAYEWSMKSFDYARTTKNYWAFWMVVSSTAPKYALVNFKIEEAIEAYLTGIALANNLEGSHKEKQEQYSSLDEEWLFSQKPNQAWNEAENATIRWGVIPLIMMIMNLSLNEDQMFEEKNSDLKRFLADYQIKASDKLLWELVLEIYSKIITGEITKDKLSQRASVFSDQGKLNLQLLCVLGIAFQANDHVTIIQQLINILPLISQLHEPNHIVIKHCLVPFVRTKLHEAIKDGFVGGKKDLNKLQSQLNDISSSEKKVLQLMLSPLVDEFEIEISEDRKGWLAS